MTEREWRIGELARETGVTVRALHHYDRLGLLTPSSRTPGGHRCYTGDDVRRLHRIVALRDFGFGLGEIADLLRADADHDPRDLIREQLEVVDERIARALVLRRRLLGVLGGLDRAVEPSISEFLRLTEETLAMTQPLTPEEFVRLVRRRRDYAATLSEEEFAALARRRAEAFESMDPAERERLSARRAALVPPGFDLPTEES
ncbi:MerR family transcriptional regulator [Nocardia sp. NPDC003482]